MRRWVLCLASVVGSCVCAFAAAGPGEAMPALPAPAGDPTGTATINWAAPQQTVEGFGFSTAWGSLPGDANMDAFFSVTKGAGFSIVRNRIPFRERPGLDDKFLAKTDSGAYEFTTVTDAQGTYKSFRLDWGNWDLAATKKLLDAAKTNPDYNVTKVFSTPWTPPNNPVDRWKRPTDPARKVKNKLTEESFATKPDMGGYLDPTHYQDYADLLADYVLGFKSNMGTELYSLSLQNEPNYDCDYESCDWTAQQLHDFLIILNQEFKRKGVWSACPNLKIMAPEDNNFRDSLLSAVYADAATKDLVHIAAGHQYEFGPWSLGNNVANLFTAKDKYRPNPFDASRGLGKQVWMSEWSTEAFRAATPFTQSLVAARLVHQDFTRSGLNAYVYWWSRALARDGKPSKTLWALGQYSRFARPGWRVLTATPTPLDGVCVTAFADPANNKLAIVAVNTTASAQTITFNMDGATKLGTLSLYRTSETEDMAPVGSVTVNGNSQAIDLPASSISTLYGNVTQ